MEQTSDPRLREIMVSLVKHLHGFIRDVRLTEEEFREAAAIVGELGKLTTDTPQRNRADGRLARRLDAGVPAQQRRSGQDRDGAILLGPFWRLNSPRVENGGSIVRSERRATPLFVTARVVDRDGKPVAGAEVDIWHSSPVGLYENQDPEQADMNLRGKFTTDADGRFSFRSS